MGVAYIGSVSISLWPSLVMCLEEHPCQLAVGGSIQQHRYQVGIAIGSILARRYRYFVSSTFSASVPTEIKLPGTNTARLTST